MNKTKIEWCDYTWNPVTYDRETAKSIEKIVREIAGKEYDKRLELPF